jgi:rhodanese-related sulfurtransferase
MTHHSGFLRLVAEAKLRITEISVTELAEKLFDGHSFYLIDVREVEECQKGVLPNAITLSKGIIERDIEKQIVERNSEIVVYCSGGFRSCLVADNLQKMGYSQVASLRGGLRAWLEAGYPLGSMTSTLI